MADLMTGKLIYKGEGKNRKRHLVFTTRKGATWDAPLNPDLLSQSLRANTEAEVEVAFELDNSGRPIRVRAVGEEWKETASAPPPRRMDDRQRNEPDKRDDRRRDDRRADQRPQYQSEQRAPRPNLPGDFHNPYNFIPAPPRPKTGTDLDDAGEDKLAGHDRYHSDRWSGRIIVSLTTQSPLLIPNAALAIPDKHEVEHKIYPVRLGVDGKPYLPPTSIKGMLRAAYEAVTNSRMAVFEKHKDRLAYRMSAKIGPVPARVENRNGRLGLRVMQASVMGFAAKLPRYQDGRKLPKDKGESQAALRYPDGSLPQHGDAVWAQVYESRTNRIERRADQNPPAGNWQVGWVCVTGPNINRKRYERVFLEGSNDRFIPLTSRHEELWRELIQNYKETHKRDLDQRKKKGQPQDYFGDKPGETGWSRHIHEPGSEKLAEGTLCYVEFAPNSSTELTALIPVTISRRLYAVGPDVLLSDSLKPSQSHKQLSPSERVFGWVNQNGAGAYRGNLRIGPVSCITSDPVLSFPNPGVPLAILGQPKTQQARFYAASSPRGEAQENGSSKEQSGYWPHKGLRGRKVYPHHANLPADYWDNPQQDRTQQSNQGFFQEYRRPHAPMLEMGSAKLNRDKTGFELKMETDGEQRDDQNRSITGWVKPGTEFEFEIDVTNLSRVELGALLWLLALPADHHHRLGGAKPLGFGSVSLSVNWDKTDLRDGAALRQMYGGFDETAQTDGRETQACIDDFKNAIARSYGSGEFERASFIVAFRRCVLGFNKPVHYPRALQRGQRRDSAIPPHPEGKAFEWFVANERTGRDGGPKLALPDLVNDEGLPILETR